MLKGLNGGFEITIRSPKGENMQDASAIKELAAQAARPTVLKVGGVEHAFLPVGDGKWERDEQIPVRPLEPAGLAFNTLTGLVEYIKSGLDHEGADLGLALRVMSFLTVDLVGKLSRDIFSQRFHYASANAPKCGATLGSFVEQEFFQIMLQTQFDATPERERLLTFIASVKCGKTREVVDDRVTQTVTTRRGVQMSETTPLPSPIALRPFRTFREVEQPESLFVFRAMGGSADEPPAFALFAADGDAWALTAIQSIRAKLVELMGEVKIPILA